jgi:hypothetical protein
MKDLLKLFKYQNPVGDFDAIRIGLASPIRIASKSSTGFWYLKSFRRSFITLSPAQC